MDGCPHGEGCMMSKRRGMEYRGEWRHGEKHGQGVLTVTHNDHSTTYEGIPDPIDFP